MAPSASVCIRTQLLVVWEKRTAVSMGMIIAMLHRVGGGCWAPFAARTLNVIDTEYKISRYA